MSWEYVLNRRDLSKYNTLSIYAYLAIVYICTIIFYVYRLYGVNMSWDYMVIGIGK